jgi:hypothetical protein
MKKTLTRCSLAAACCALLAATSHAATIVFTDTFDSGTGSWYTGGSTGTLSNSSSQLSWAPGATNDITRAIGRSFTSQTVAVGQTIRVTFDYTQNAATVSDILRVGLYDVANPIAANQWSTAGTTVGAFNGYYGFIRDNGTTSLIRTESATDTTTVATGPTVETVAPTFGTIAGTTTTFDIIQSTQYQVVFELTRTSSTEMSSVYRLSSGATIHQNITGSTPVVQDSFDTLVIRPNGSILLDNIQVTIIPEPTAALLGGLGMLALLRRRR